MKKRPTINDVAKAANVSLMTVSRAINNKAGVSEAMRQKIIAIAEEIGYYPNQIARGLASNRTSTIGLVVPDNTNPFFAQIARGVEETAYENGYNIYLINTNEDPEREAIALTSIWQKGIDGLISCSSRLPEDDLIEQINKFPAVLLFNRELSIPASNTTTINVNDERGAAMAIQHFVENGRKKIGYAGGPANSVSNRRRLAGYKNSLKSAGIPFDPKLVVSNFPNIDGGRAGTVSLLTQRPEVDAIFAFNDLVAIGAIQACEDAGRKVPEDIAIIGVDDIPLASIIRPHLSTLHVNLPHLGHLATRTLLDIISGKGSSSAIQIGPELIIRDSA